MRRPGRGIAFGEGRRARVGPQLVALLLAASALAAEAAPLSGSETDAALGRLAAALRFETVSHQDPARFDGPAFVALHAYLAAEFPRTHAALAPEVVADYSLLFTWPGSDPELAPVLLTSHLDVVPVNEETIDAWEHPPFGGVVADGYLWGRGALDDKVGVLGMLEATERLLAAGYTPTRTVYLAFGHDEERGGREGAGGITAVLRERGVELWFSLDEGMALIENMLPGLEETLAVVGVAEKGSVTLRLTARGAGGHSSVPPPSTAIGQLSRALVRVEENPLPAHLDGPGLLTLDAIAPLLPVAARLAITQRWLFGPLLEWQLADRPVTNSLIRTTTAVTMVDGGTKSNVLPKRASATVNFRILPGDTADSVEEFVRGVVADPDIEIERAAGRDPSPVSSVESEAWRVLAGSIEQTFPDVTVAPGLLVAGTDTSHYGTIAQDSYRFTPFRLALDDASRIHGLNERLRVDDYGRLVAFYETLIRNTSLAASSPAPRD